MSLKEKVINDIIDIEGAYVNNPNDSGGETKYGITKATAIAHGYIGNIRELSRDIAFSIYSSTFWDAQNLSLIEKISPNITKKIADIGVNLGRKRAAIFLQRCLNVLNYKQKFYKDIKVDGNIGKRTISSLEKYLNNRGKEGEEVLLGMLSVLQGAKYISLAERREKDETFIYGWFKNRIIEPVKLLLREKQ